VNNRLNHLRRTLELFWKRWRKEYLDELREAHHTQRVGRNIYTAVNECKRIVLESSGDLVKLKC
jgi:hypothetical protein